MKLLKLIFYFFIITINLFAQIEEVNQITNYDFDSKNPSFNSHHDYPFILFESHKDSSIGVAISSYSIWNEYFETPIFITNNGADNRNPISMVLDRYNLQNPSIIIWETNINGNTDIVYKEYFINGFNDYHFSETFFITETPSNERSISLINDYWYSQKFELVYEREGSIFLFSKSDSIEIEEVVFPAMDCGCVYSQPTGTNLFYANNDFGKAIAVVETNLQDSTSKIVYKYRLQSDATWSEIKILYDSTNSKSPKFFASFFENKLQPSISFEAIVDGKNKILYYNFPEEFGNNSLVYEYYQNEGETSNFSSYLADTGIYWGPAFLSVPNSAKMKRNDSTFVLVPENYFGFDTYELIQVKYPESQHKLGNLGNRGMLDITYTIWEDSSSNNRINLFAKGRYEIVVGVEEKEEFPTKFILEQNYPNPFNPSTTIKYEIPGQARNDNSTVTLSGVEESYVTLIIYDILGREVATLVNKKQSPGNYSVVFDASGLTSGLYFYKLSSGGFISIKKMILIK